MCSAHRKQTRGLSVKVRVYIVGELPHMYSTTIQKFRAKLMHLSSSGFIWKLPCTHFPHIRQTVWEEDTLHSEEMKMSFSFKNIKLSATNAIAVCNQDNNNHVVCGKSWLKALVSVALPPACYYNKNMVWSIYTTDSNQQKGLKILIKKQFLTKTKPQK